jgi:hypothetical protein
MYEPQDYRPGNGSMRSLTELPAVSMYAIVERR